MSPFNLAYSRKLLGIMKECNARGDCSGCAFEDDCREINIPQETAYYFEKLLDEVESGNEGSK